MRWRIYRVPGSREWWLIDHGPGSLLLACHHWTILPEVLSVSSGHGPADKQPREWIEVFGADLSLIEHERERMQGRMWIQATFTRSSVPVTIEGEKR
jgi:hypothetical protein